LSPAIEQKDLLQIMGGVFTVTYVI